MPSDRRLLLIYTIILLDVIIGAAIGPSMPEFVRGLPQPQLWLSGATGLFLGVQLFSAPVLGRLSDGYGRRPILIVAAVGTLLANVLLLPVRAAYLFANRLSDGLTNGMYATIRSAITDISPQDQLFKNLGIEGAIISLGFVLGPMATGVLLTVLAVPPGRQAHYIVGMAVALAALNVALSLLLRETHQQRNGVRGAELRAELSRALNVFTLWQRLATKDTPRRGLRTIVLMQVALTMSTGYYFYFVAFASLGPLRLDARQLSYYFMFFGSLSIGINYVFYTYFADRLNQRNAIFWLALAGVPVLAGYGLVGTSWVALGILTVLDCLSLSLIQGLLEGLLAQRTTDEDRGEIFGLNQALQGLASFATTLIFGGLSVLDLRLPFGWFALCLAAVAWQARRGLRTSTASEAG
ncbi:MFS transporter, DHA1 family, tetracycline resistance protein [Hymenobacter daecheongensis DSM 21074]|uniref:MFS transporter, DHA1 family, tetracycline resistance protein n=1 Tax=Hymenobacter daecheongensis DSM 21074 TaxID=1121955 RepID=A0A1M6LS50_9BACT|nr:MFS transporter [Hymenobacter daecheongensis]SHJ74054.1 MFS transporter, DHA1 family, tetracycline resistance protein [Hymenobacter daecheongensis DSM 21074]